MAFLSAALMVRNEEACLERCLKSLSPLYPEIVILDTGSTDGTLAIAKRFTDKIYHQPWADDFSLHRNTSFSYATGQWILQIDADEELVFEDGEKTAKLLLAFLKALPDHIDAVAFPLRDWRESQKIYSSEVDVARLFRAGRVTYHRRIHNRPEWNGQVTYFDKLYIKHHGYDLDAAGKKKKAERTITLLLKSIDEDPNDYESFFYLSQAYQTWLEDTDKCIEYGRKYIDMKSKMPVDEFNHAIYHSLASVTILKGDLREAGKYIRMGLAEQPYSPDLWFDTLKIAVREKNARSIATASQNYVSAIRRLKQTRTENLGGQFFFHTDPESVAAGLYYLTVSYLENGASELAALQKVLGICNEMTRKDIADRINGTFRKIGVGILNPEDRAA